MSRQENLVSGLITKRPHYLTVKERLQILGEGGKIIHEKSGANVWLNNESGKLNSDVFSWVSSLPGYLFNNDILFIKGEDAKA